MRYCFLLFSFCLMAIAATAQSINIDSCGLDTFSRLTKWEILYFKEVIPALGSDDLSAKNFAFAEGNYGSWIITKKDYFDKSGKPWYRENLSVSNMLIILTAEEKRASGGYDYVIVSWSKFDVTGKHRKKLIEQLHKHHTPG